MASFLNFKVGLEFLKGRRSEIINQLLNVKIGCYEKDVHIFEARTVQAMIISQS